MVALQKISILGSTKEEAGIALPADTLHTYIIGNTGTGKTTLERMLIKKQIDAGHGVCVLDPHGERQGSLTDLVLSDLPSQRERDVILFDINRPEYIPGLTPFYCRDPSDPIAVQDTISTALNMFEKVYNVDRNTMARIIAYIEALIYLFIFHPSLTILDIPSLLNPDIKYDKKRFEAVTHLPQSPGYNFTRDFWTEEYSRRAKRGYNQDSEIFGTLMKFRELSSHLLWPLFCHHTNTLDLREIMHQQKILLVRLSGNWEDITSLLGTYIIGQIKDAAFHRSLSDPPFYLYADEFQKFASKDFLTLFSESRGGNLHVTIDHQVVSQLDDTMKETIRQASAFICFRITDISASQIGGMFDCSPRPGLPRLEPLRTPVKEPIQHMLTRGVHPVTEVRDFIDQYGNLLVEGEKREQDAERRVQSIFDRLTYSTSLWAVMPPHPPAFPEYNCRFALQFLNELFYQAMLFGREGKDPNTIAIASGVIDYVIKATSSPSKTYLDLLDRYRQLSPQITNRQARQWELHERQISLPYYRYHFLYPYYHKKRTAHHIRFLVLKRFGAYPRTWEEEQKVITASHDTSDATTALHHAIASIDAFITAETERIEEELALLAEIAAAQPEYDASYTELEQQIRRVMNALARAPVEEASGLMQEVPTELSTPEVEARIANELKLLPAFTARVRIGTKEATLTTLPPPPLIAPHELQDRKARILQHNLTDGYLRLRSEVETTFTQQVIISGIGNGHHSVQPVPIPRKGK